MMRKIITAFALMAAVALSGCGAISTPADRAGGGDPSPSPTTASAAPSVEPATPTPEIVGWDAIVANHADLQAGIDEHAEALGFDWEDVQKWAKLHISPDDHKVVDEGGDLVDARATIAFGDTSESKALAATSCTALTGSCPNGDAVLLLPLVERDGVIKLSPTAGLVFDGDFSLVAIKVANTG